MTANFNVTEKNDDFRLHFMLHVDKKSQSSWDNLELPFPAVNRKQPTDKAGVSQLPVEIQRLIHRPDDK